MHIFLTECGPRAWPPLLRVRGINVIDAEVSRAIGSPLDTKALIIFLEYKRQLAFEIKRPPGSKVHNHSASWNQLFSCRKQSAAACVSKIVIAII